MRDRSGILASVSATFARYDINIEAVLQLPHFTQDRLLFAMTLEACSEAALDRALADIAKFDFNVQPPLSLPMFM